MIIVEFGLLPDGDEFVLACPPEIEAAIYPGLNHPDADISEGTRYDSTTYA